MDTHAFREEQRLWPLKNNGLNLNTVCPDMITKCNTYDTVWVPHLHTFWCWYCWSSLTLNLYGTRSCKIPIQFLLDKQAKTLSRSIWNGGPQNDYEDSQLQKQCRVVGMFTHILHKRHSYRNWHSFAHTPSTGWSDPAGISSPKTTRVMYRKRHVLIGCLVNKHARVT